MEIYIFIWNIFINNLFRMIGLFLQDEIKLRILFILDLSELSF